MRITRSTSIPRSGGRRRIVLSVALASGAALLAAAFVLHAPTTVRGSDTADAARPHKVTTSAVENKGGFEAVRSTGQVPTTTTAPPATTTTTVAPVPTTTPRASTPTAPRTATTTTRAIVPAPTAPPATAPPATAPPNTRPANYNYTFSGPPLDACTAEFNKLRNQGYVRGDDGCTGMKDVYTAIVSNGTVHAQILASTSGQMSVGFAS